MIVDRVCKVIVGHSVALENDVIDEVFAYVDRALDKVGKLEALVFGTV